MKYLTTTALLALSFDAGLALDSPYVRRQGVARHKYKREITSALSSSSRHTSETAGTHASQSDQPTSSSVSCIQPTVTVTFGTPSTIVTTTMIIADSMNEQISHSSYRPPKISKSVSHSSGQVNSMDPYYPNNTISTSSSLVSTIKSISSVIQPLSAVSSSSISTQTACPTGIQNKTAMQPYFGFNVVNQKPHAPRSSPAGYRTADDWVIAFQNLKRNFPYTNAVRMYSTQDDSWPHLEYALQALDTSGIDLKILVGVWSDDYNADGRFDKELEALERAIVKHGCDNIFAVSVGNEDLERVKLLGTDVQTAMVEKLAAEISSVRNLLHKYDCCVPVTHTDTYNELRITTNPWVAKLLSNVDQAIIANIFPYWENSTRVDSWYGLNEAASLIAVAADEFGKEVWLGETGWPFEDAGQHNMYGTKEHDATDYFEQIGCEILSGQGTAFYYVDWDEDNVNNVNQPSWGVLNSAGNLRVEEMSCVNFKRDMDTYPNTPRWLGGIM